MNNGLLVARVGAYKNNKLYYIRVIVNHWLKSYGTSQVKPCLKPAGLSQTLEAAIVPEAMLFDKVNHFINESEEKKRHISKFCNSQDIQIFKKV